MLLKALLRAPVQFTQRKGTSLTTYMSFQIVTALEGEYER